MTVAELIETLKTFPPDLPVVYQCCSEYNTLEAHQLTVDELCQPRPDGWVHEKRPDKPSIKYLAFPGN